MFGFPFTNFLRNENMSVDKVMYETAHNLVFSRTLLQNLPRHFFL